MEDKKGTTVETLLLLILFFGWTVVPTHQKISLIKKPITIITKVNLYTFIQSQSSRDEIGIRYCCVSGRFLGEWEGSQS